MDEQSHPNIDWVVPCKTVVAFGHTIDIDHLLAMYQSIFKEVKSDLHWLMKRASPELPSLETIVDSISCQDPEYSFLGRHSPEMLSFQACVLAHPVKGTEYVIRGRFSGML
jgi:hypothetical protein